MELPRNYHPHSRYVLREAPWGYMSADLIHSTPDGPVFDLGVDLDDRHGIAFIRVSDVEEMARVLGMSTIEETQALKKRIEELNAEVLNVPREVESLKDGLSSLVADFLDRVVPRADSIPNAEEPAESEGKSEGNVGDDDPSDDPSGQDGNDVIDKGPTELSGDSSDEFGFAGIKSAAKG